MKKHFIAALCIAALSSNKSFAQFAASPALGTTPQSINANVGIGTPATASRLDLLSTTNQLRLSYSGSIFSDIQTNSSGNLILNLSNTTTGKIGIGTGVATPAASFHSNVGTFRMTDPLISTRGLQFHPTYTGNGEIPAGSLMMGLNTTANEGMSFASSGSGTADVKLGAYAYAIGGWKSVWETKNEFSVGVLPNLLLVKNAGNVGIGTGATAPQSRLHIANAALGSTAGNKVEWMQMSGSSGMNGESLRFYHNRHSAGNDWNSSEIKIQKKVDATDMHYISFKGTASNALLSFGYGNTDFMSISEVGQVAIGAMKLTSGAHTDAKLSIDGKTVTKSLYVTLTGWADYVFAPDYQLPNLYDVEKYYLANKHLPEIPSEKEVIENGIDVAEMNKLLLKKIEEMTIMMVKQQKDIDALNEKLK